MSFEEVVLASGVEANGGVTPSLTKPCPREGGFLYLLLRAADLDFYFNFKVGITLDYDNPSYLHNGWYDQ